MKREHGRMTKKAIENGLAAIDNVSDLVERLIEIRKEKGITQKEVAKYMGVNQSAIARFENMLVIPKANTLFLYADAIGEKIDIKTQVIQKHSIVLTVFEKNHEIFEDINEFDYANLRFDSNQSKIAIGNGANRA